MWFRKVQQNGVIVIPKEIRDKLGIHQGTKIDFIPMKDELYLRKSK